jgi:hypothetical protein
LGRIVNVKLSSYFLVIDERYPNVVNLRSFSFRASADDSYCFGTGDGNKRLDFQQHPLTRKVTQANGKPGCKDLACMTNMEKGRPRT